MYVFSFPFLLSNFNYGLEKHGIPVIRLGSGQSDPELKFTQDHFLSTDTIARDQQVLQGVAVFHQDMCIHGALEDTSEHECLA